MSKWPSFRVGQGIWSRSAQSILDAACRECDMALFRHFQATPRLRPELDDTTLGGVYKKIQRPPTMPDARNLLVSFVEEFVDETGIDWERRWHRLSVLAEPAIDSGFDRAWLSRRPTSANALILRARTEMLRVSGGGSAGDLRAAVEYCHQASKARPHDPLPLVALIGLSRLLRSPHRRVESVWHEAALRDPWNRAAHLQMLDYLADGELGSPGLAREFVEVQRIHMPADAPAAALELTATVMSFQRATAKSPLNATLADMWWRTPYAGGVLDRATLLASRPEFLRHAAALEDLNVLAYALVQAGRVADAAPVFNLLGPIVTSWPWDRHGDPVEQFTHWRTRAYRYI
jgi:hypothetical protein